MIKKLTAILSTIIFFLFFSAHTHAASINPCPKKGTTADDTEGFKALCDFNAETLGTVVRNGITILFIVAVLASLFFLIAGGIKWITSGGDKANLEQARNWIVAAAVGLIITFASYFILNLILEFFGLPNISTFNIPTLKVAD